MEFWNNILHTALLGTEKADLSPDGLGVDLAPLASQINSIVTDREDRFLRTAALAFSYRQAGASSMPDGKAYPLPAPPESKPYCSTVALQALVEILAQEQNTLLPLWLKLCRNKDQLVTPDMLPILMEKGAGHTRSRKDILACGGQRARWLAGLNPDWSIFITPEVPDEERWETGSPDDRINVLVKVSQTDPDKAREWLLAAWPKEDANTKASLLSSYIPGPNDLPFLESLIVDKSKKVREAAFIKLQGIPSSSLVQQYQEALKTRLLLKKEKGLLGLSSKFVLAIESQPDGAGLPALLTQSGIEKLSNNKVLSDDEYICLQLMYHIPLDFYATHWQKNKEEIIKLFVEDPLGKKLLPALMGSINHNQDTEAALLLQRHGILDIALIPQLPEMEQDAYTAKIFASAPEQAMAYVQRTSKEWGRLVTEQALRFVSKDNYRFSHSWVRTHIDRIPVDAISMLPNIQPFTDLPGASSAWPSIRETLFQQLQLKNTIITAFK